MKNTLLFVVFCVWGLSACGPSDAPYYPSDFTVDAVRELLESESACVTYSENGDTLYQVTVSFWGQDKSYVALKFLKQSQAGEFYPLITHSSDRLLIPAWEVLSNEWNIKQYQHRSKGETSYYGVPGFALSKHTTQEGVKWPEALSPAEVLGASWYTLSKIEIFLASCSTK